MAFDINQQSLNANHITRAIENENIIKKKKLESGLLGQLFGSRINSPNNIAALAILLGFLGGFGYTILVAGLKAQDQPIPVREFWGYMMSIITGGLGFMFGGNKAPTE